MTTQLEYGITAIRKGDNAQAKTLLTQVLKENNQNEQAWLWLSEAVDTVGEQISCIEQVLLINPHHRTAKLALQKLKAQPPQRLVADKKSASPALLQGVPPLDKYSNGNGTRKPFRLSEMPAPLTDDEHIHHEATVPLPPTPTPTPQKQQATLIKQASAATQSHPIIQEVLNPSQLSKEAETDTFPLLPVILFGTLSVTAIGGVAMIILLLFFN